MKYMFIIIIKKKILIYNLKYSKILLFGIISNHNQL